MTDVAVPRAALFAGAGVLAVAAALLTPASATAADLTCIAPPGAESVDVDGSSACGARIDHFSRGLAWARDSVAFARAEAGGDALGVASAGGVAAAETSSGHVGAVSLGRDSVSIVSPDPGALAAALSLTRGQTFVGTVAEGVRCEAGAGIAVNVTSGQFCISDGINTWSSP